MIIEDGKEVRGVEIDGKVLPVPEKTPFLSFKVNEQDYSTANNSPAIAFTFKEVKRNGDVLQWTINFTNLSADTILLHNVHTFNITKSEALIIGGMAIRRACE